MQRHNANHAVKLEITDVSANDLSNMLCRIRESMQLFLNNAQQTLHDFVAMPVTRLKL